MSRSHSAGERFSYEFDAEAARPYLLKVDQRGLDLIVSIEDPDGATRVFDSPLFRDDREFALLESVTGGTYRITIYSDEFTGAEGAYTATITSLLATTPAAEIEAWRWMTDAAEANFEAGTDGWDRAISLYLAAYDFWGKSSRPRLAAQALFSVATIEYWQRYDWDRAIALAPEAAKQYEYLEELELSANATHLYAAALLEKAAEADSSDAPAIFKEAVSILRSAESVHEAPGNIYELAQIRNNIGLAYFYMEDYSKARKYWREASVMFESAEEWSGDLMALSNLAVVDSEEGYFGGAIEALEQVVEILPKDRMLFDLARTKDNLAGSYRLSGDFDAALRTYTEARELHRKLEDLGEAYSVLGLGQTYVALGDLELATEHLDLAIPMLREANDYRVLQTALSYRGQIEYLRGNFSAAADYHAQGLELANVPAQRAQWQMLLSRDLIALGRYREAGVMAVKAMRTAERLGAELILADTFLELGRLGLATERISDAQERLREALSIYESLGLRSRQADALYLLARAGRNSGNLELAVALGNRSLESLEAMRARVADPELRALFAGVRRDYFDQQIDFLVQLHSATEHQDSKYLEEALAVSERARARMMMDLLAEASVDLRQGIDPGLSLRLESLYDDLSAQRYQRDRLLQDYESVGERAAQKLSAVVQEMFRIENEINVLETDARRTNPRFAALGDSVTLTTPEMREYLGSDSALLQYSLGAEASFAWLLTGEVLRVFRLPPRAAIESAARKAIDGLRNFRIGPAERQALTEDLAALSQMVLGPVSGMLDRRRLIISADGVLLLVPFSVLMEGAHDGAALLHSHDVVMTPSVTVAATQFSRSRVGRDSEELLILADPIFALNDSRLESTAPAASPPSVQSTAQVSVFNRFGENLARLPYTGLEAKLISSLVPEDRGKVLSGFSASRDNIIQMDLKRYKYIHFATHGLVDTRYPALSALALSSFNQDGMPVDGMLRLNDIYGLKLNADLVVLSACDTALGREIVGEGLVGLSQGFLYAGARGLIVSLWQVPDRAAAELMTRLYRFMLSEGLAPETALRKAQASISAERRWRHPYFWGGLVLVGV